MIVVIAILAAVTIVAYGDSQNKARVAAQQQTLVSAAKNATIGYAKTGSYPIASALPTNPGITLSITGDTSTGTFCITASGIGYQAMNINETSTIVDGPCDGQSGGAGYCPESLVTNIDGYYCKGTYGSKATQSSSAIRLAATTAEVPAGAPGTSVGRQNGRDNYSGGVFAVTGGQIYCVSGWGTTTSSTVGHTIGIQMTGPSLSTQWHGVNYLTPANATNQWVKMSGCVTVPTGYTGGQFWTQNSGDWGTTAVPAWYQTALTLTKK